MKFVSYLSDGLRLGLLDGETVWDLRELLSRHLFEIERTPQHREIAERLVPADMGLFIRLNHGRLGLYEELLGAAREGGLATRGWSGPACRPLAEIRLVAPLLAPNKVVCCGNSYGAYLVDQKLERKDWPQDVKISFLKPPTALIGPGETILYPADSEQWDYETELSIVIGRFCSDVTPEEAPDYIFGYTLLNDACVRDIPAWTGKLDSPRGKAGDTLAPLGPCIVPSAKLGSDPNDLRLRTTVDGEVRQDDSTAGLLWPVERIVAMVSRYIRLHPGDVISTGSPPGNAWISGKWLREGQVIRCEADGIGVLENPIGRKSWRAKIEPLPPP